MLYSAKPLTFEDFPNWAEQVTTQLELVVVEREQGADYYQWLVSFEDTQLFLCFQHYAGCAWLEALSRDEQAVAEWLTAQWQKYSLVE